MQVTATENKSLMILNQIVLINEKQQWKMKKNKMIKLKKVSERETII